MALLLLPFFGIRYSYTDYVIQIPKLSKSLINIHLINEVNLCNLYDKYMISNCMQRFEQDYFHTLNIEFTENQNIMLFKTKKIYYDDEEDMFFYIDIMEKTKDFRREYKFTDYPEEYRFSLYLLKLIREKIELLNLNDANNDNIITDYKLYMRFILDDLKITEIPPDDIYTLDMISNITYVNRYDYTGYTESKINVFSPLFLQINNDNNYTYEEKYNNPELGNVEDTNMSKMTDETNEYLQSIRINAVQPITLVNPVVLLKNYKNLQTTPKKLKELFRILVYAYTIYENLYINNNLDDVMNDFIKRILIRFNIYVKKYINELLNNKKVITKELEKYNFDFIKNNIKSKEYIKHGYEIIRMFYQYVYLEKKTIHPNEDYFLNESQKNYLLCINQDAYGLQKIKEVFKGINGGTTFLRTVSKDLHDNFNENVILKQININKEQLLTNFESNHMMFRDKINSYFLETEIDFLFDIRSNGHILNVKNNFRSFLNFWNKYFIELYIFDEEKNNNEDRYLGKINFTYSIIKIIIACSAITLFEQNPDLNAFLVKDPHGSLGQGIGIINKKELDLEKHYFNLYGLDNLVDNYITENNKYNLKIYSRENYVKLFTQENDKNDNINVIKDFITNFLNYYETKPLGKSNYLVYQQLILDPVCDITNNNIYNDCYIGTKDEVNQKIGKDLEELPIPEKNNPDRRDVFYTDLMHNEYIDTNVDINDTIEKHLCLTKAPVKIRIFVLITKKDNVYTSLIPEIAHFEYLFPFKTEYISTYVYRKYNGREAKQLQDIEDKIQEINKLEQIGLPDPKIPQLQKEIKKMRRNLTKYVINNQEQKKSLRPDLYEGELIGGTALLFTPYVNRYISNSLPYIDNSTFSKKIALPRLYIDNKDTYNCMNNHIFNELEVLSNLLTPSLVNLNISMPNNSVGRYAIDVLYKSDDPVCKLKVIDINNDGALLDQRAGYLTISALLKLEENSPIVGDIKIENTKRINKINYNLKTYQLMSNNFCLNELINFNDFLKINKEEMDDTITELNQRYIITVAESELDIAAPGEDTKYKYLKYKEKYLKLKKKLRINHSNNDRI